MVYMIEECRGSLFLNRFSLLTGSMDEETRLAKVKEYTEGPLAKLSKYLESHIMGSQWLLSKVSFTNLIVEFEFECLKPR